MFILFLSCEVLLPQEQERHNYFPLAIGNRWEYIKVFGDRFVMEITRDTIMDNGQRYYIFEYNAPCEIFIDTENLFDNLLSYIFIPLDPVRMDENGDIYVYDDSTQIEYLYLKFSKYSNYQPYGTDWINIASGGCNNIYYNCGVIVNTKYGQTVRFYFKNNIGMVLCSIDGIASCWGTIYNPCPPFWDKNCILVYAIIDGEKVYSIEDDAEYLNYIDYIRGTNNINPTETHPQQVQLHQNYPNPFNPETRIDFEIPKTDKVKLVIYNMLGKNVKTLLNDELQAGKYSTTWNGKDDMNNKVSSGIYFYQLTFGNNMQSTIKKLILIK